MYVVKEYNAEGIAFLFIDNRLQGIPLQRDFAKGMEKLMGADEKDPVPMKEPLVDIFPNVKKPTFKFLEEGTPFTEKARQCTSRLDDLAEY